MRLAPCLLAKYMSVMTPREAELTRQLEAALSALESMRRENERKR